MKMPSSAVPFLKGDEFSNGLVIHYDGEVNVEIDRIALITDLCKGKRVLHIGFADHLPLIEEKRAKGIWLHDRLTAAADRCIGIDIDQEAVSFCRDRLGIADIHACNVVTDPVPEPVATESWDIAVLGEIIEHVPNPVQFLSALKEKYGPHLRTILITAPNAWELGNILGVRRNREFINTDHRFWFTPYTLGKVGTDAGLTLRDIYFAEGFPERRWWRRMLKSRYPMLRENLVCLFDLHE